MLFDFEKNDFEDKHNISEDNGLKNQYKNKNDKNFQNDGSETDENSSDSKNKFDDEKINDLVLDFKNNINEILKNYGDSNSKKIIFIMILIQKKYFKEKNINL